MLKHETGTTNLIQFNQSTPKKEISNEKLSRFKRKQISENYKTKFNAVNTIDIFDNPLLKKINNKNLPASNLERNYPIIEREKLLYIRGINNISDRNTKSTKSYTIPRIEKIHLNDKEKIQVNKLSNKANDIFDKIYRKRDYLHKKLNEKKLFKLISKTKKIIQEYKKNEKLLCKENLRLVNELENLKRIINDS